MRRLLLTPTFPTCQGDECPSFHGYESAIIATIEIVNNLVLLFTTFYRSHSLTPFMSPLFKFIHKFHQVPTTFRPIHTLFIGFSQTHKIVSESGPWSGLCQTFPKTCHGHLNQQIKATQYIQIIALHAVKFLGISESWVFLVYVP